MFTSASLCVCLFCLTSTICNAGQSKADITFISSFTVDVRVTCDVHAFLQTHPPATFQKMRVLQIVQHTSKENRLTILATLNVSEKSYTASSFLKSTNNIFALTTAAANTNNEETRLRLSLAEVQVVPNDELSYKCQVLYELPGDNESSERVWSSDPVVFTGQIANTEHQGIDVEVSEGLALTCFIAGSSSKNTTSVERFEQSIMSLRNLCRAGKQPSRATCKFSETPKSPGLGTTRQVHLFDIGCGDEGTYLCRLTTSPQREASTEQIRLPSCLVVSALSWSYIAKRIALSLLVVFPCFGCLMLMAVIWGIGWI